MDSTNRSPRSDPRRRDESAVSLILREVERGFAGGLKWTLELRRAGGSALLVAHSTRNGLIHDVQQLGALHAAGELPSGALELIADRIREELVRAKLAAVLSRSPRRQAA